MGYTIEKWCEHCKTNHVANKKFWYFFKGKPSRCREATRRNARLRRQGITPLRIRRTREGSPNVIGAMQERTCEACKTTGIPEVREDGPHVGAWCKVCGLWLVWLKQAGRIDNLTKVLKPKKSEPFEPRYSEKKRRIMGVSGDAVACRYEAGRAGEDAIIDFRTDEDGFIVRKPLTR